MYTYYCKDPQMPGNPPKKFMAFQCNRPLWDISWMITASDQLAGSDPWPLNRYACPGVVEGACASDVATSISMRKADVKSIEKWFFFLVSWKLRFTRFEGVGPTSLQSKLWTEDQGPHSSYWLMNLKVTRNWSSFWSMNMRSLPMTTRNLGRGVWLLSR